MSLACFVLGSLALAQTLQQPGSEAPDWRILKPSNTGIPGDYVQTLYIDEDDLPWIAAYIPIWEEGGMANGQLTNYVIPTSEDVPPIRVVFLENPFPHGAQGAKGIGELPIDGPAPAVANAIARATGADPLEIPVTPERLATLLANASRPADPRVA